MNKLHYVYVPMTGVGIYNGYRGDEWLKQRIEIFKDYTLKSLINQTSRNFILWMSFRKKDKKNSQVKELKEYLDSIMPYQFIFTFDGLMYQDDKYVPGFINKLKNLKKHFWRYKNKFWALELLIDKNATLQERLKKSIEKLYPQSLTSNVDLVLVSRIDSDDCFADNFIETIQNRIDNEEGVLTCQNGYIYNTETKELALWKPKTNPPFHTLVFNPSTFFNPYKHYEFIKEYRSHEEAPFIWKERKLGDNFYLVTVHGKTHISTNWNHPFRTEIINDTDILNRFGIDVDSRQENKEG